MRSVWIISPIIAIGLVTSAPAQQQVDQNTRQQIEQIIAAYHDAWNKQDAAGVAALYTSDGVFVGSDVKAVSNGRQEIIDHYQDVFKRGITHHESATIDQFIPVGDNVVASLGERWSIEVCRVSGERWRNANKEKIMPRGRPRKDAGNGASTCGPGQCPKAH